MCGLLAAFVVTLTVPTVTAYDNGRLRCNTACVATEIRPDGSRRVLYDGPAAVVELHVTGVVEVRPK